MRGSRSAYFRQISSVRSVDALSHMMSSKSRYVCESSESTASTRNCSPLYTGRPMLTRGGRSSISAACPLVRLGLRGRGNHAASYTPHPSGAVATKWYRRGVPRRCLPHQECNPAGRAPAPVFLVSRLSHRPGYQTCTDERGCVTVVG